VSRLRRVLAESGFGGGGRRALTRVLRAAAARLHVAADRIELHPDRPPIRLSPAAASLIAPNAQLRGCHRGERGFILATGPSITPELVEALRGEVVIAANEAALALGPGRSRPAYGIAIDPYYFSGVGDLARFFADLAGIAEASGASFMFDVRAKPFVTAGRFGGRPVFFLQQAGQLADYARAGVVPNLDLTAALPGFPTVSHAAIAVALEMGFSEIYLLGHDYSFVAEPDAAVSHFYGISRYYPEPPSLVAALGGYSEFMECLATWHRSYDLLRRIAEARGQRIWNATPNSHLAAFERVAIADVLCGTPAMTGERVG
jgi:hypothetical protein